MLILSEGTIAAFFSGTLELLLLTDKKEDMRMMGSYREYCHSYIYIYIYISI